jgi:hypothetical protein
MELVLRQFPLQLYTNTYKHQIQYIFYIFYLKAVRIQNILAFTRVRHFSGTGLTPI